MSAHKLSDVKAMAPRLVPLGGTFTIGNSGAVSDQDDPGLTGGEVTQTGSEDGRYTVTFNLTAKRILGAHASMTGPDDSAFPTTTGSSPKTRNLDVTGFDIQFVREDTQADADPASGTIVSWFAMVALM